jgi:hypothetical protein
MRNVADPRRVPEQEERQLAAIAELELALPAVAHAETDYRAAG